MLLNNRRELIIESEENIDYWLLKERAEDKVAKLQLTFSMPENAYLGISRQSEWLTGAMSSMILSMIW